MISFENYEEILKKYNFEYNEFVDYDEEWKNNWKNTTNIIAYML